MNIVAALHRYGISIKGRTLDLSSFDTIVLPDEGVSVAESDPYDDSELVSRLEALADEVGQLKETVALLLDASGSTSDDESDTPEEPDTQEPSEDETE